MSSANTLVAIWEPPNATLDIIAAHGMNVNNKQGHADNTWKHDTTEVNWLRDLLPGRLPNARILAFQYNANVVFGASIAGVEEQATNLLNCLRQRRELNPIRPIIFIAHSLGGIIVKEALATAFREPVAYPMIWTFTYAIFFLAVPHKGSNRATWGQIIANIILTATVRPTNRFVESVKQQSNYNNVLNARFKPLHEAYRFYSWIEALPLGTLGIIVEGDSATLGLPATQEQCRTSNRDHRTICKFSGAEDLEWAELSAAIVEAAQAAAKSFDYSPTIRHRTAMLPHASPHTGREETISLVEAISQARNIIVSIDGFYSSQEHRERQQEAENATHSLEALGALLFYFMGPILNLLSLLAWGWLLTAAVALLPSQEYALERASVGQASEQTIMDVETWTIDRLNERHHSALRASHMLRQAVILRELNDQDDNSASELTTANALQERLIDKIISTTNTIQERQQRYDKAEATWRMIEELRRKTEGRDKVDFYRMTAEAVRKEKEAPDNRTCPECVIQ